MFHCISNTVPFKKHIELHRLYVFSYFPTLFQGPEYVRSVAWAESHHGWADKTAVTISSIGVIA